MVRFLFVGVSLLQVSYEQMVDGGLITLTGTSSDLRLLLFRASICVGQVAIFNLT